MAGACCGTRRRNQQILRRLQAPEELEEEVEEVEEAVCVDDGDVEIVEAPDLGHGAPLTLVLRTKSNKSYEVETTTVRVTRHLTPPETLEERPDASTSIASPRCRRYLLSAGPCAISRPLIASTAPRVRQPICSQRSADGFRVRQTAPLSEVFERFHASDLGKALVEELGRQAKFSFDGEALQPTQTALQVELEDRDIVDAL
jgi:hypothetical protein